MIILCQKCGSRLQVDETKIPSRPFTIRCPKCNANVDCASTSPAVDQSAIAVGGSPATGNPRFEQPRPAPLFELEQPGKEVSAASSVAERLVELLSGLLNQSTALGSNPQSGRPSWNPRTALVCIPEDNRVSVARAWPRMGIKSLSQRTRVRPLIGCVRIS
jgi:predicted Zn finger-like uncharacterized protein